MIMRAGEPPPTRVPPEPATPPDSERPKGVRQSPPRTIGLRRSQGLTDAKPGSAAPGSALLRLEAFLTATNGPTQDQYSSGLANRARLIKEAAVALRAERAGVLMATTDGTYRGWAVCGLTPTQTRRFLETEWRPPNAAATGAQEQMTFPPSMSKVDFPVGADQDQVGPRRRSVALPRMGQDPCGWLLLEFAADRPPPAGPEEQILTRVVSERLSRAVQERVRRSRRGRVPSAAGIARERRLLKGLLEAGASIHKALNLDQVLQRIAGILAQAAGFEAVAIYILEAKTQTLRPTAIVGVSEEEMVRMRSVPLALKDFGPLMRPEMRLGRSYLFDHRRHQMPVDSILDSALVVPDMPQDWRPGQWHPLDSLTVPLELTKGELLGLISLDRPQGRRYPSRDMVRALELFADQCAAAISRAQIYQYMEELALTDSLTGLHNRHALEQTLAQDLARIARHPSPYSVLFCDLDHLKEVNDSLGHKVGDQTLQQVAAVLRQRLRRGDFAARWGGDEFVILLPDTPIDQAWAVADDLRHRIASATTPVPVTASIGVACPPADELDARSVLEMADAAMYLAKRSGRNRVAGAAEGPRGGQPAPQSA